MNLLNKCTKKEIELIEKAGLIIENKDYSNEELNRYVYKIADFIVSHSSKNGDIEKLNNEYSSIFNTIKRGK